MLKNNLRLDLETIHHGPRRQAGGMAKDSLAGRPPHGIWKAWVTHLSGVARRVRKHTAVSSFGCNLSFSPNWDIIHLRRLAGPEGIKRKVHLRQQMTNSWEPVRLCSGAGWSYLVKGRWVSSENPRLGPGWARSPGQQCLWHHRMKSVSDGVGDLTHWCSKHPEALHCSPFLWWLHPKQTELKAACLKVCWVISKVSFPASAVTLLYTGHDAPAIYFPFNYWLF